MRKEYKLYIAILYFLVGIFTIIDGFTSIGILLFLCSFFLAFTFIRTGSIFKAINSFKRKDFKNMNIYLDNTINVKWLKKGYRAYYYYLTGFRCIHNNKLDEAFNYFEKALEIGFRTENDIALLYFQMALIKIYLLEDVDMAKTFLEKAKELKSKEFLTDTINELYKKIIDAKDGNIEELKKYVYELLNKFK